MNIKDIKSIIDSCIGQDIHIVETHIKDLFDKLIPQILQDYEQSREVVQYTVSELEKVHYPATYIMMANVLNQVQDLSKKFIRSSDETNEYIDIEWTDGDIKNILDIILPHYKGTFHITIPNMIAADAITFNQRRQLASFIIDSIQYYGVDTQWKKENIEAHQLYLALLYAICKKDNQMKYLFYFANNLIDKLATTQEAQNTRDMAETILVIGHQEGMQLEAYLCASRAYTILNNPTAGLLYLEIALKRLGDPSVSITYKISFEILWQVLKVARGINFYNTKLLNSVVVIFDTMNPLPYDINAFYHTYLSLVFYDKQIKVLEDIADFLDENREIIYKHLDHAAMPWLSLIFMVKLNFPKANLSRLNPYINAFRGVVNPERNALMLDIFDSKNENLHLRELMVRLESTRNILDYSHDNHIAMILAKMLISKSVLERNPGNFLLSMHLRADYTFVKPENIQSGRFKTSEFKDVNGNDYSLPIEDPELLDVLMQQEQTDEVIWIGKGIDSLYYMSLLENNFSFGELNNLSQINTSDLQRNIIRHLHYVPDIKKSNEPIYIKSPYELEQEAEELKHKLSKCQIIVSDRAERLLLVKDMDIAGVPHHLLTDAQRNEFIGSLLPTCNIISTEVLIKTNFANPLQKYPSCKFWSPLNCNEFTFEALKSKLEDAFEKYHVTCNEQNIPFSPLDAEINIACAHGGADISNTQWFYADDIPIVDTAKIIGKGKLLILFVCHSGSITRPEYDNAMHTLIKRYIRLGYSSIIAPMWSLNTEILPLWLTTFMGEVWNGRFVIDALFSANMTIRQEFTSPEVYACLHLFGNPFLQIAERPILEIDEITTSIK